MWKLSFVAGGWKGDRRFRLYRMYGMDSAPMAQGFADVGFVRKGVVAMAGRRGPIVLKDAERTVTLEIPEAEYLYRLSYDQRRPNRLLVSGQFRGGGIFSWAYAPGMDELVAITDGGVPADKCAFWDGRCYYAERLAGFEERRLVKAEHLEYTPRREGSRRRDNRIREEHGHAGGVRMSCNCHGKSGVSVTRTSPYDQCTACAKKHVVKAWSLFNEFTYTDDNRDAMTGQLRLAVDHLMYDHTETARLARDLAVMLEENRDAELGDRWETLLAAVRNNFNGERPEVKKRQEKLKGIVFID